MADFTLDWEDDEPISERKHFVDREEFKKILTHGVEDPQTIDERRVLVFYGAGGQGKSALKNDFFIKEYLTGARGTGVVFSDRVDFEDQPKTRWADESLLRIAQDLIDRGSIPLPAFCLGFIRYKILTSPESNLQQEYPFLFKVKFIENDFANEIFNSIISSSLELLVTGSNMVPGVNFFTKKISEASNRKIIEWIQKSDAKKVLGDIDELNSLQLLQRLPLLLAYDINKYLKRSTHPRRIVIIFDGYEALWRDATHYDADKDAWVRTLVEKTPGVLFVMFGREKMQWGEKNEAFNNILHQYLVKGLPDKDADHLLQLSGVAEEDVRGQIILASKVTSAFEDGCLPFFLDLQINTYLKIQKSGRSPVSADFHKYDDDVITHFLEHLHLEVAGAIRALATAPYIDEEIIELFVSNNIILPNAISLMSLRRHSFIRMDGEKAMMHSLMKDLAVKQYASEFKLRFAKVNHLLFQYFDARALTDPRNFTVENGLSLELAARYKALDDRSGYSAWAVDKVKDLVSNEVANRFVTSVLGTAKDIFENDTRQRLGKEEFDARDLTIDEALAYSKTMFYLAKAYDLAGQYRFTLDYSLSCAAFSKMEGERIKEVFSSNDQELKNKLTTFFEIRYNAGLQYACILDTADDNANADKFYRVAEDLRNDILFSANEVPYALFKSKMGRHAEAEPVLFAEYLQLKNDPKASGLKLSTASHNVALCLYRQQRYDEALRYQTESLQVLEAHGEKDSSQYLTSLLLLATVLIETGLDLDHASSIYEHVLRVYRDRYEDDHVNFGHLYMGISKLYSARGDFNEMDRCFNLGAQILSNRIGPGCRPIMEGLIEATTTSEKLYRAGEVPEAAYKALRRGMASLIQSDVDAVKILLGAYNPHFHRTIDAAADELLDSGDEAGAARLQAEAAELRRLTNLYSQIRYDHLPHKTLEGDEKEAAIVLLREKISLPEDPERVEIIKIDLSFFKTFRLYKITYKNTPLSADRFVLMNDREITPITRALRQVLEHIEADGVIDVNSAMDYFIFFYDCQAGFFIIRNADDVPWRLNADVTESDKANFAKWITHPKIISASDDLITIRALMVSGDAIFRCDFDIHPKPVTNSHGTFNAGMCFQRNDWLYTFKSDDSLLLSGYVIQDGVEVKVKTDIDGNPVELSDDEETFCGLNIAHMPVYQARKLRTTDDLISQLLPLSKQYADLVAIMIPGEEMEGLSMHISSRAAEFTTQLTREEKIDFDNLKDFVRTVLRVVVQYRALVIQSIPDENDWRIKTVDMHLNLYNYLLSELDKTTTSS